jgi:uncharacterized protein YbjQ (UPF0145 family)
MLNNSNHRINERTGGAGTGARTLFLRTLSTLANAWHRYCIIYASHYGFGVVSFDLLKQGDPMATQYHIIFEGKVLPGKDVDSVKKALMALLKADTKAIDRLFSGKPVVIQRNVNEEIGERFRKAFEKAGALCAVEPVQEVKEAQEPADSEEKRQDAITPPKPMTEPVSAKTVQTADGSEMIITNIETVPGKNIVEHFGMVSGNTIRAKHVGRDIMATLKNLVGGEIKSYTRLLQESREQAMERMIEQARQLGANAIVNVRLSTSSVAQGAAELYAYGTAVRIE